MRRRRHSPLPESSGDAKGPKKTMKQEKNTKDLSFSSRPSSSTKSTTTKRKAVGDGCGEGSHDSAPAPKIKMKSLRWARPSPSQTMLEQGGTRSDATPCVHIHFNSSAVLNSLFVIFLSFFPSCVVACAVSRPIYRIQNLGTYLTTACLSHALTAKIAI